MRWSIIDNQPFFSHAYFCSARRIYPCRVRPLSSKLYWSKLISILFKIRDVVYVQITNISLASRLSCRSRSLTAVTSHLLAGEIRCTLSSNIISYMHLIGRDQSLVGTNFKKPRYLG